MDFVKAIEDELGIKATNYVPKISVKEGVAELVAWFKDFYNIES
jgi:UDP-glucuronate 4-epimerase